MQHKFLAVFTIILVILVFIVVTLLNENMIYASTLPSLVLNETISSSEKVRLKKENTSSKKILCRRRPEYVNHANLELAPKIVTDVETMLMFIGYPRSGHTLIGSLLDAHPNMVMANEYNILTKWEKYTTEYRNKQYLFEQLYTNSYIEAHEGDRSSEDCLPTTKYYYLVPNQWQGKFDGKIKIIGDKKGGETTKLLSISQNYGSFLQEIRQVVKVPVKFIHVIRNPFDNIATMALRSMFGYNLNWTEVYKTPVNISKTKLIQYIHYYMKLAETNAQLLRQFGDQVHTLRSEDVIANPELELRKICRFLNIQCSKKYIGDCISIVNNQISRSRDGIIWKKEVKDIVFKSMKRFPFYSDYKFHETNV